MSVSFQDINNKLFWNIGNISMADIRMKKACNINGPVSLVELGRSYAGFQKMNLATQPSSNQRSDVVNVEYINNPPNLRPFPNPNYTTDSNDPFNERFSVEHGGYGDSFCGANANMWLTRRNPNVQEELNWKFRVDRNNRTGTSNFGIVVKTYPARSTSNGTVAFSLTTAVGFGLTGDYNIDLPADGNPYVVFSLQNTAPKTGTSSTYYGCGISRWQVKYR